MNEYNFSFVEALLTLGVLLEIHNITENTVVKGLTILIYQSSV